MEKRVRFKSAWLPWLLVAPQLAIVIVFFFWPAGQAIYQSFLREDAFGTSTELIQKNPNTFAALYRAVLTSAAMARDPKNRELIAKVIAPQAYLNQPEAVINQVLTGKFADGLGKIQNVPDRADFDPMPWQSMAVWMLTQMQRWGYIKGDVDYKQIAEKVFLITDAKKQMKALDQKVPDGAYPKFKIMGREFDAAKAAEYAKSFPIRKAA